jgi:hypothetical protein
LVARGEAFWCLSLWSRKMMEKCGCGYSLESSLTGTDVGLDALPLHVMDEWRLSSRSSTSI